MNRFTKTAFKTGFLALAFAVIISGCKKDEEKTAPAIPPASTFTMDFSGFSNPGDTNSSREVTTYHNWGYAYLNVISWNTLITVGLAVPVAAFNESFNHQAVYHPDNNNWT